MIILRLFTIIFVSYETLCLQFLSSSSRTNVINSNNLCNFMNKLNLNMLSTTLESYNSKIKSIDEIFCNREMHGKNIEAVGFDMDFTLAQYNEAFDLLAYNAAKEKLHKILGYPQSNVEEFQYDSTLFRRGLIIDKKNGNVVKIDRHRYARIAYHGLTELDAGQRKTIYNNDIFTSFTGSNYISIDTLFSVVDAILFAQLVDLKDKFGKNNDMLYNKSYEDLYSDVRTCVDLCHRDGVIKDAVMKDPAQYIIQDPNLVPMLERYKEKGKKIFLLTNSLWEYTDVVMKYLVNGHGNSTDSSWTKLFDIVVVGACKPAYLTYDNLSMFRICESTGVLENIEDKDAFVIGEYDGIRNVFQGGTWNDLHKLLNISKGEKILYVGDHMYSDILRSKRTLGWRTCLIIPELEHELTVSEQETDLIKELRDLRQLQYDLDEFLDLLRQRMRMGAPPESQLNQADLKAIEIKKLISLKRTQLSKKFNPVWGQLFKAGHQDSNFAQQVCDYACLYTSKASNLGMSAPDRPFRPFADNMPHDRQLSDE